MITKFFLLTWLAFLLPTIQAENTSSSYQVVHEWPRLPNGFALGEVSGVGVDSHDHVFIFHRGDQPILCFDEETGEILASWGDGLFERAHGLTTDHQDNIWVTDTKTHQVSKFSHDGELLLNLGSKGVPGLDGNHFNQPTDVAVSVDGDVFVADGYGNNRIAKFSAEGKFLLDWGHKGDASGQFHTPHGITLDLENRVYVADRTNARIQVFDEDGNFLYQFKNNRLGRPWGLEVGGNGYLYVVDGGDLNPKPPDRGRLLKLDTSGKILRTWSSFGSDNGQIYWGHDVAVSKTGNVYVTDIRGMRVQKFTVR